VDASGYTYPGRLVRALFVALEQTAGPSSLGSTLEVAGLTAYTPQDLTSQTDFPSLDFVEIAAFGAALEALYGTRGGRGIALRTGGAVFDHGLRDYGAMHGVGAPQFKSLPVSGQAQVALQGLAGVFSHISDQHSHVEVEPDKLKFIADPSPFAWGRESERPVCHVLTGLLGAALRWATDGYHFSVYETACRASGSETCVFQISKKPIGRI